jgi:glycosyltransferase involved in cell wall biosynthesis
MKDPAQPMALKGQPILSLASERWDGIWFSRQHLLSRIAQQNQVLYVTSPFHIRDVLKSLGRKEQARTGLTKITHTLYTYVPPRWLPYNYRLPWLNRTTSKFRIKQIRRALRKLGMKRPVMYIWDPSFVDMLGQFDESLVVYHCYDEYRDFPGISATDRQEIRRQEDIILARADIVFAASSSIYKRKVPFNANTHIVLNAADYPLFATAQDPQTRIPEDLLAIPRPIIGCVTRVVASYFNTRLLRQVFSQRPDWSLVVIGPESVYTPDERREVDALKKLPNVYLLGRREQIAIPGYLKGFDVCLMAYPDIDNVMHSESPLKMYEYLAAGKPIVSTPLPLISHLDSVIGFAQGAEEWIKAIERSLSGDTPGKIERRQAMARSNTWDQKAAFISWKLADELARRQGRGLREEHNE